MSFTKIGAADTDYRSRSFLVMTPSRLARYGRPIAPAPPERRIRVVLGGSFCGDVRHAIESPSQTMAYVPVDPAAIATI
jgi:hypothetical protein